MNKMHINWKKKQKLIAFELEEGGKCVEIMYVEHQRDIFGIETTKTRSETVAVWFSKWVI